MEKFLSCILLQTEKTCLSYSFIAKKKRKKFDVIFFVSENMAKILFFNSKNVKILLNSKFTYVEKMIF